MDRYKLIIAIGKLLSNYEVAAGRMVKCKLAFPNDTNNGPKEKYKWDGVKMKEQ